MDWIDSVSIQPRCRNPFLDPDWSKHQVESPACYPLHSARWEKRIETRRTKREKKIKLKF